MIHSILQVILWGGLQKHGWKIKIKNILEILLWILARIVINKDMIEQEAVLG
jgi:hypothetical protein